MSIEVFSFFSGLGFMDLGFEEAGFDIAFVNEYNHNFIQAYQYARRNRLHSPRYKLASSEGLNKHTNRMIRYNVLKDFLCDEKNTDDIQNALYDKIVNYVVQEQ